METYFGVKISGLAGHSYGGSGGAPGGEYQERRCPPKGGDILLASFVLVIQYSVISSKASTAETAQIDWVLGLPCVLYLLPW